MPIHSIGSGHSGIRLAEASVRSALSAKPASFWFQDPSHESIPFVTVSREPGAGAIGFAHRLAEKLSETDSAQWTAWDQELVEKISSEHHLGKRIVDMIEDRRYSWVEQLMEYISMNEGGANPDEVKVYRRTAVTIRALAQAGRAVIVGRGGVFVTAGMPGGTHLRLVASLEYRIANFAQTNHCSEREAAKRVAEITDNRARFYHRHWPKARLVPETFTLTLNVGQLSLDDMVACVLPAVRSRHESRLMQGAKNG